MQKALAVRRTFEEEEAKVLLRGYDKEVDAFLVHARARGVNIDRNAISCSRYQGIIATAPRLAARLVEPLKADKEELYDFEAMVGRYGPGRLNAGYFGGELFLPMAHQFLRQDMNPNGNFPAKFLEPLWRFHATTLQKSIAIDEHRVRLDIRSQPLFERDYWYGPVFNEDVAKTAVGDARLAPPGDLQEGHKKRFFAGAHNLQVNWTEERGIKTFQALEFKLEAVTIDLDGETFHPVRYLHAEFDLELGFFRHFDGAVQLFRRDEYLARREGNFRHDLKSTLHIKPLSRKLFKLNGEISINDWVNLSSMFFIQNPLMHEYFCGSYPVEIGEALERIKAAGN